MTCYYAGPADIGSMKPSDLLTSANHSTNILGQHISRSLHNDGLHYAQLASVLLYFYQTEINNFGAGG